MIIKFNIENLNTSTVLLSFASQRGDMRQKYSWSSASNSCKYQRLLLYCANNQIRLQTFETTQQCSPRCCTKYLFNANWWHSAVDFLYSPTTQSEVNGQQFTQEVFFPWFSSNLRENEPEVSLAARKPLRIFSTFQVGIFREPQISKERRETLKVEISIFKAPMSPHYDRKPPAIALCVAQTLQANCLRAER